METQLKKKIDPSYGGSFGNGWEVMSKYFLVLLLVVIILGVILFPTQIFRFNLSPDHFKHNWDRDFFNFFESPGILAVFGVMAFFLAILALAYVFMIVPVFKYGADLMFVHAARDTRPQFETLVKGFKENYLFIVLANLLKSALIMLSLIFLIIPGIIVACRLAFVSYLIMDKKLDPIIAVEESWRMTKGNGWTIFFMGLTSFFIYIFGFALLFVGILPASMWVKSSFASLYEAVNVEKEIKMNGD